MLELSTQWIHTHAGAKQMIKRLITTLTVIVLAIPQAWADPCVNLAEPSTCRLEGRIFALAVDDSRFLVGVDSKDSQGDTDGVVDLLFLFADNQPPGKLPSDIVSGSMWIDTGEKIAEVRPDAGAPIAINFRDRATSVYGGFGPNHRLELLESIQLSPECDHVEGSCWFVEDWNIGFPR